MTSADPEPRPKEAVDVDVSPTTAFGAEAS
jgi:hypothetical protein